MAEGKHHRRPLKATDKRRLYGGSESVAVPSGNGASSPAARLFHDRRGGPNGKGKRAT